MVTRMCAAKQLLQALESLPHAGFVHRGSVICTIASPLHRITLPVDLSNRNVMWGISPLVERSTKPTYEYLGQLKKLKLPLKM